MAGRRVRRRGREIHGLGHFIGHYGCSGRLVKVAAGDTELVTKGVGFRMPKPAWTLDCPACEFTHGVRVQWRHPVEYDEHERAELKL